MFRSFLFLLLGMVALHAVEPWPGVKFTEVRAFAWPAKLETEQVVLKDMTPAPGVLNKDGALLTAFQTKRLLAALRETLLPRGGGVLRSAQRLPFLRRG